MRILEYSAHEEYWGSDHRPVYCIIEVVTMPQQYLNPLTLLNYETPVQGHIQINFLHTIIEFKPRRVLEILAENFKFPLFF